MISTVRTNGNSLNNQILFRHAFPKRGQKHFSWNQSKHYNKEMVEII